jgi:hypothetical protein
MRWTLFDILRCADLMGGVNLPGMIKKIVLDLKVGLGIVSKSSRKNEDGCT